MKKLNRRQLRRIVESSLRESSVPGASVADAVEASVEDRFGHIIKAVHVGPDDASVIIDMDELEFHPRHEFRDVYQHVKSHPGVRDCWPEGDEIVFTYLNESRSLNEAGDPLKTLLDDGPDLFLRLQRMEDEVREWVMAAERVVLNVEDNAVLNDADEAADSIGNAAYIVEQILQAVRRAHDSDDYY